MRKKNEKYDKVEEREENLESHKQKNENNSFICLRRSPYFYPIILCHLLTASFLLSVFSSFKCDYLHIEIGFQPLNEYVDNDTLSLCPLVGEYQGGCYLFPNNFRKAYIDNDMNWLYAQIGSLVSIICGFFSFITIWMMLIGTCSHIGCWKNILEILMLAFSLSETSKLMLMRTNICRSKIWIRKATDGVSIEVPKSCILSTGAKLSFAAIICNILCISLLSISDKKKPIDDEDMDESYCSDIESNASLERGKKKRPEIPKHIDKRKTNTNKQPLKSEITCNENDDLEQLKSDKLKLQTKNDISPLEAKLTMTQQTISDSRRSLLSSEAASLVRAGMNKHRERKNDLMNEATRNRVEAYVKAKKKLDESKNDDNLTERNAIQI